MRTGKAGAFCQGRAASSGCAPHWGKGASMSGVIHQLRVVAGGLLCGAAFMIIALAVAGAF
jgi:hypothetical protein